MNTVNPWKHQQGKFRQIELIKMERWAAALPASLWKFTVVHQHFANIPGHDRPGVFPRGEKNLARMAAAGIHGVMHGHVHYHHVASSAEFFPRIHPPLALVCAGTPTSLRTRGAIPTNNFNVLKFYPDHFEVYPCIWHAESDQFTLRQHVTFDRNFYS